MRMPIHRPGDVYRCIAIIEQVLMQRRFKACLQIRFGGQDIYIEPFHMGHPGGAHERMNQVLRRIGIRIAPRYRRIMVLNGHLGLFIVFRYQQVLRFDMQFFCQDRSFFLRKRSGFIQDILCGDAGARKQGGQILRL